MDTVRYEDTFNDVDFDRFDAEASSNVTRNEMGEYLPAEGEYPLRITSITFFRPPAETPGARIGLVIDDTTLDRFEIEFTVTMWLTAKSLYLWDALFDAVQIVRGDRKPSEIIQQDLVGKTALGFVSHRVSEWTGREGRPMKTTYPQVEWLGPVNKKATEALEEDDDIPF